MMCSPLILGNDLRSMKQDVLDIITNKELISIDQDELGIPAKRMKKGGIDVLVRPLFGDRWAICVFNKRREKNFSFPLKTLTKDEYVKLPNAAEYSFKEVWTGKDGIFTEKIEGRVGKNDVKVYILKAKK